MRCFVSINLGGKLVIPVYSQSRRSAKHKTLLERKKEKKTKLTRDPKENHDQGNQVESGVDTKRSLEAVLTDGETLFGGGGLNHVGFCRLTTVLAELRSRGKVIPSTAA